MPEFDATVLYRSMPGLSAEFYLVGSDGSLWSRQKRGCGAGRIGPWRRLKDHLKGRGYRKFRIAVGRVIQEPYVHQLVLETFIGPCPSGMECRHLNGDKTDNRLVNLCWGTRLENSADKVRHGTLARGSRIPWSVLTEEDIPVIRSRLLAGQSSTLVAESYGVSHATIEDVQAGRTWKHV
jgi:hypothetical protein